MRLPPDLPLIWPKSSYKTVVFLLDRYSVSTICQQARLRPASLRKHAVVTRAAVPPPVVPPLSPFLQLNPGDLVSRHAPAADSHARLLFERADGWRLTLHLSTADPAQLEALCLTFLCS